MTAGDVDRIRAFYVAREGADEDAILAVLHPDIEAVTSPENPDQIVERGYDGFERFLRRWGAVWEDYEFEPEEFLEGGGSVLVLGRARARSRGSDVEIEQFVGHLWTMEEGRAIRLQVFHDRDEALSVAGLA
jgi:ketosteroid isomerase-like protein